MSVNDADEVKSVFTSVSQSRSSRSATPGLKSSKSSKVKENDFPPLIRELAIAAKAQARMAVIYDTPFPPTSRGGRVDFAWKVIKEAAHNTDNSDIKIAFKQISSSSDVFLKQNLLSFVSLFFFTDRF